MEVRDLSNGNTYLWERNRFLERQSLMNDVYETYEETGAVPSTTKVSTKPPKSGLITSLRRIRTEN